MAKKSLRKASQTSPTPRRETDAYQPRMRDRLLRSLQARILPRLGVPGLNYDSNPHRFDLREVEDLRHAQKGNLHKRRYLHFDGRTAGYGYQQIQVYSRLRRLSSSLQLRFFSPESTLVCHRRQARRRVLHALQKTGRNGRGNRRARWTAASHIRCK